MLTVVVVFGVVNDMRRRTEDGYREKSRIPHPAGWPELSRNGRSMDLAKDAAICVMASCSANSPIAAFIGLPEAARKLRRSPDASGTAPADSR